MKSRTPSAWLRIRALRVIRGPNFTPPMSEAGVDLGTG